MYPYQIQITVVIVVTLWPSAFLYLETEVSNSLANVSVMDRRKHFTPSMSDFATERLSLALFRVEDSSRSNSTVKKGEAVQVVMYTAVKFERIYLWRLINLFHSNV